MRYNIVPEYIACFLIALLGVYSLFDKNKASPRQTAFQTSLAVSLIAIVNNIVAVNTITSAGKMPVWFSILINTLDFLLVALMTAMISMTVFMMLFEGRYHERRLRRAAVITTAFLIAEFAAVLYNVNTGLLFSFDEAGVYRRGPLNPVGIFFLVLSIGNIVTFTVLERVRIKRSLRTMVTTLACVTLSLGAVQFFFPYTALTGTIACFALLTLFINGQQQRAYVDALTELADREAFFYDAARLIHKKESFCAAMIVIRNMKEVNSQHGQRGGDAFISEAARYLESIDPCITPYRISGVEFTLIATKLSKESYETRFLEIQARFDSRWQAEGHSARLHALFADICYPSHAASFEELVGSLEHAIRMAKDDPSSKPVRFNREMQLDYARRIHVIRRIETALREDLFYLNFQPIYDVGRNTVAGAEVLLRLSDTDGQPITPGEFIPLAIQSGVSAEIAAMVMGKALGFLDENPECNIGWLSINISAQQDELDDSVRRLRAILAQHTIDPCRIKLEITEMMLLDDPKKAQATMDELKAEGVGVFLDDFGTGYSNLINVMTLPFECVKIDKGFIANIVQNERARGMLETIVNGLRALDVSVLAEGVETREQDEIVRGIGIERIQGYYYSHPIFGEELIDLVKRNGAKEKILPPNRI